MIHFTEKELKAIERACLALDVSTETEALDLVGELKDYFGILKVGKELHTRVANQGGPALLGTILKAADYRRSISIFLDLKLHDTPNTVYEAAKACAAPGVSMFNIHISGGEEMCKKAVEGAQDGKIGTYTNRPKVIGVTELTSLDTNDLKEQGIEISYDDLVMRRTELARKWGLDGVVCPANKAGELEKRFGSDFLYVTPGIKWEGKQGEGQKQLYTPDMAVRDCSNSILVIGSAVTKAENKTKTAYEIIRAMAKEL